MQNYDIVFYSDDGQEVLRIDNVAPCNLNYEPPSDEDKIRARFYKDTEMSFEAKFDEPSLENFNKYVIYGGDRGRYNGWILKRDGYLSPENGWIKGH